MTSIQQRHLDSKKLITEIVTILWHEQKITISTKDRFMKYIGNIEDDPYSLVLDITNQGTLEVIKSGKSYRITLTSEEII